MNCELKIEILNLHACPGDAPPSIYTQENLIKMTTYAPTEHTIDKQIIRSSEEGEVTKRKTEKELPLYEFRQNDDDYIVRFGGPYGKLMGLFKETGGVLYNRKVPPFKTSYKPFLKSLNIKPQWITLNDVENVEVATIPQITAGRSRALILQYYRRIGRCTAMLNIDMPDDAKPTFKKLIAQAEGMPFGPKRRGEIHVLEMKWD